MSDHRFGFLDARVTLTFLGGEITPADEFDDASKQIAAWKHKDGFLYPPTVFQSSDGDTELPNTRRPSHQHKLPASHALRCLADPNPCDPQRAHPSFVMQMVAYLFETWLQFDDWWFDARVPLRKPGLTSIPISEDFLSHAYTAWQCWPACTRQRFVSALFMFNRAPSYQWDWEHFAVQYIVFDALHKTATDIEAVPEAKSHKARIDQMCKYLGLARNSAKESEFVRLRNDLLHEAIWDGVVPGNGGSGDAFMCQFDLRRMNQRLIPAILGYKNDFVSSSWWPLGASNFGPP